MLTPVSSRGVAWACLVGEEASDLPFHKSLGLWSLSASHQKSLQFLVMVVCGLCFQP